MKFYIYDKQFNPQSSPSPFIKEHSKFRFIFLKKVGDVRKLKDSDICFYTDQCLKICCQHQKYKFIKIAWIREPPAIHTYPYAILINNEYFKNFDKVVINNHQYVSRIPNSIYFPNLMTFLRPEDITLYSSTDKTKLVSIVCSDKRKTSGHRVRHNVTKALKLYKKLPIHMFGKMVDNFVENKIDTLKNYKFQVVIENSNTDGYYSEKILDCFLTGTVPIYWGTNRVLELYDEKGIIMFANRKELVHILKKIFRNKITYESMLESVKKNYETAKNPISQEVSLYRSISNGTFF